MNQQSEFEFSHERSPHRLRPKQILQAHPEIKKLIGKNPFTFIILLLVDGILFFGAWFLQDYSWWWTLGAAFFIGAFASHTLFVIIHECTHNLLFKRRELNMLAGILANLPQVIPSYVSFTRHHLEHHAHQGVYEMDPDLPSRWEARLIGSSFLGKALWLTFFPLFQIFRLWRFKKKANMLDGWLLLNIALVFSVDALVIVFLGPKAFVFLFLSLIFSIGPHPLGARWIQEHYLIHNNEQETSSYYGPLNWVALNVGFHNEHHDFPAIPWHRLPKVKALGGHHYDGLESHSSWTKLFLQFLFDRRISLFSRTIRSEPL